MAVIERNLDNTKNQRIAFYALGGLATLIVVGFLFGLRRPPQMGPDDEVFHTVDALYTAVRSHDEKRIAQCEKRFAAYKEAGKLPKDAATYVEDVIAKSRGGKWDSATRSLYDFMMAQRRDGYTGEPKQTPDRSRVHQAKAPKRNSTQLH